MNAVGIWDSKTYISKRKTIEIPIYKNPYIKTFLQKAGMSSPIRLGIWNMHGCQNHNLDHRIA